MAAKGKWAQGITPRNFTWIIKDQIAVCERPGGYAQNHRKVRRQEEIIWIREQGFAFVFSLIPSTHNLHNYDEYNVAWRHRPYGIHDDHTEMLSALYPEFKQLVSAGHKIIIHQEELNDRVCGLMAGYLLWDGLVETGPEAIAITEHITSRQLGPLGREQVSVALALRDKKR